MREGNAWDRDPEELGIRQRAHVLWLGQGEEEDGRGPLSATVGERERVGRPRGKAYGRERCGGGPTGAVRAMVSPGLLGGPVGLPGGRVFFVFKQQQRKINNS